MFALRRIFRNNKQLTSYVSTSSVLQCKKDQKISDLFKQERKSRRDGERRQRVTDVDLSRITANLRPPRRQRTDKGSSISKLMSSSVEKVANELGGDEEKTKRELMEYVKMLDAAKDHELILENFEREFQPKPKYKNLSPGTDTPKEELDREVRRKRTKPEKLGIFKKSIMNKEDEVKLKIWDSLTKEELAQMSKRSPSNYFEELINWTNEGKLWKFPIDNDQGMDREAAVPFTEHVFLEKHLEPWCPRKGPIRKFMDMVLIGLAKNPYLSAKEKQGHIMWFKRYFEEKKKLLQELGAMGPTKLEVSSQESASS